MFALLKIGMFVAARQGMQGPSATTLIYPDLATRLQFSSLLDSIRVCSVGEDYRRDWLE